MKSPTTRALLKLAHDAREGLIPFTIWNKHDYEPEWFHHVIAEHLELVEQGVISRLIINMPPRYGKSELGTTQFPAWLLGRDPDREVIVTSYSDRKARDFGRKVRNIMRSRLFNIVFPFCLLSEDSKAKDQFHTTSEGGLLAVGRGGSITGSGADFLIMDDLVKDLKEAQSPTISQYTWEWYQSTSSTRLNQKTGAIVMLMTRWMEEDIVGRALEQKEEKWVHLNFPVLNPDPQKFPGFTRPRMTPLWPSKHGMKEIRRLQLSMGNHFLSLYQQSPSAQGGNIFKAHNFKRRLRRPPTADEIVDIIITGDTAFGVGQENDYTAVGVWYILKNGIYLAQVLHERLGFPELVERIKGLHMHITPKWTVFEDKASGISLIQQLRHDTRIPIIPFFHQMKQIGYDYGGLSKVSRARLVEGLVGSDIILLPHQADWITEYIDEMTKFPKKDHDDYVDMTVIALLFYMRQYEQVEKDRVGDIIEEEVKKSGEVQVSIY